MYNRLFNAIFYHSLEYIFFCSCDYCARAWTLHYYLRIEIHKVSCTFYER